MNIRALPPEHQINFNILVAGGSGRGKMSSFIKSNLMQRIGIDYELVGDYYPPCFKAPYSPPVGRLPHRYLKEHRRVLFFQLLTSGKLGYHLEEIKNPATDIFHFLIKQMAKAQGVTEKLKADDMMKWVGLMNNIRSAAEEVVSDDLIYAQ